MTSPDQDLISLDELFAAVGVAPPAEEKPRSSQSRSRKGVALDTTEQDLLAALGVAHPAAVQKQASVAESVDGPAMDKQEQIEEQKDRARQWKQELEQAEAQGAAPQEAPSQEAALPEAVTQPLQASVSALPDFTGSSIQPFSVGSSTGRIGVLEGASAPQPSSMQQPASQPVSASQAGSTLPQPAVHSFVKQVPHQRSGTAGSQPDLGTALQPQPAPGGHGSTASASQLGPVVQPLSGSQPQPSSGSQPQFAAFPPAGNVGNLQSVEQQVAQEASHPAPPTGRPYFQPGVQPVVPSSAQPIPQGFQHGPARAWQQPAAQPSAVPAPQTEQASSGAAPVQPLPSQEPVSQESQAQSQGLQPQAQPAQPASQEQSVLQPLQGMQPLEQPVQRAQQEQSAQPQAAEQDTKEPTLVEGASVVQEQSPAQAGTPLPPLAPRPGAYAPPSQSPGQAAPMPAMPLASMPSQAAMPGFAPSVQEPTQADALEELERETRSSKLSHIVGGILIVIAIACVAIAVCLLTGVIDLSALNADRSASVAEQTEQLSGQAAPSATSSDSSSAEGQATMTSQSGSKSGDVVYAYVVRGVDGGTHEAIETATFGDDGKLVSSKLEIQTDSQLDSEKLLDQLKQEFGESLTESSAGEDKVVCTVVLPRDDLGRDSYTELLSTNAPEFKIISS